MKLYHALRILSVAAMFGQCFAQSKLIPQAQSYSDIAQGWTLLFIGATSVVITHAVLVLRRSDLRRVESLYSSITNPPPSTFDIEFNVMRDG